MAGAAALLLAGGLVLVVGGIIVKAGAAHQADRLRSAGVAVTAAIGAARSDTRSDWASADLTYEYAGRQFRKRINCPDEDACDPARQPTMTVWVDPDAPDEFVAANGATDSSRIFLNSWKGMLFGVLFLAFGAGMVSLRLHTDRPVGTRPGLSPRPRRPGRGRSRTAR